MLETKAIVLFKSRVIFYNNIVMLHFNTFSASKGIIDFNEIKEVKIFFGFLIYLFSHAAVYIIIYEVYIVAICRVS